MHHNRNITMQFLIRRFTASLVDTCQLKPSFKHPFSDGIDGYFLGAGIFCFLQFQSTLVKTIKCPHITGYVEMYSCSNVLIELKY